MRLQQAAAQLNSFLHEELAAIETYKRAMDRVSDRKVQDELQTCERSHEQRAEALRTRIRNMGGRPAQSSPAWPLCAGGEEEIIVALEDLEGREVSDYEREKVALDNDSRTFVERNLIPEAQRVHDELDRFRRTRG
jgi:hypothetical protein